MAIEHRRDEVVRLLVAGKSTQEIGDALDMTPNVVRGHIFHARHLVGAKSRTELVLHYLQTQDEARRHVPDGELPELVLELELPIPESANRIWRSYTTSEGVAGVRKTQVAKDYMKEVAALVAIARAGRYLDVKHTDWWGVEIELSFGKGNSGNLRRDLDNAGKLVIDALFQALRADDKRVLKVNMQKSLVDEPYVRVRLWRLLEPPAPRLRPASPAQALPAPARSASR